MRVSIVIISICTLMSCRNKNSIDIYGKWKLDSSSGPSGKLFSSYLFLELILNKDNTFNYKWREGNVGAEYKGKYFLKDSTDKLKTLELVTDTSSYGFQRHFYYTIFEVNNNKLKGITKESYTTLKDSLISFDRIDIFKKQSEYSNQ